MAITPRTFDQFGSFFHTILQIVCSFEWFKNLCSNVTRLIFIEHRRLKRARAQHVTYWLKMIFGGGFLIALYYTFTPN